MLLKNGRVLNNVLLENIENTISIKDFDKLLNSKNKVLTLLKINNFNLLHPYNHTFCLPHLYNQKMMVVNNNELVHIDKYNVSGLIHNIAIHKLKYIYSSYDMLMEDNEIYNINDNQFYTINDIIRMSYNNSPMILNTWRNMGLDISGAKQLY